MGELSMLAVTKWVWLEKAKGIIFTTLLWSSEILQCPFHHYYMNDLAKLKRMNLDYTLLLNTDRACILSHLNIFLAVILFSYRLLINVSNGIKRFLIGPQLNNQHFSQNITLALANCDFFFFFLEKESIYLLNLQGVFFEKREQAT